MARANEGERWSKVLLSRFMKQTESEQGGLDWGGGGVRPVERASSAECLKMACEFC